MSLALITTDPPKYGDSNNTLLLKWATAAYQGTGAATGFIKTDPPKFGDSNNTLLLKIATSRSS